jgi:diguanylate cyclase (GGDEF)-like protein
VERDLALALADARLSSKRLALLFRDLDSFKVVNDTLGHGVGDQLLVQGAARLKAFMRAGDTVGRPEGGDEFLLLTSSVSEDDPVRAIAATVDEIFEHLLAPFQFDDHELSVSPSGGIAAFPDGGSDADTPMRKADAATYVAKAGGRSEYRFFTEQMNLDAVEYEQIRNGLRHVLERVQLRLHY